MLFVSGGDKRELVFTQNTTRKQKECQGFVECIYHYVNYI